MGLFDRLQDEIERRETNEGLHPVDLLDLPPDVRRLVQTLAKEGATRLEPIAASLNLDLAQAQTLVDQLVEKGILHRTDVRGVAHYKAYFARRPGQQLPTNVWDALSAKAEEDL